MLVQANNANTCAIVLAGGKSLRMGQDKALLEYNGKTFLEHVVAAVRPLCHEVILVVDRMDRYALPRVRMVEDVFADSGPVAGVVTGLMAAGAGAHFVASCDMPLINRSVLSLLRDGCLPSVDAAVPELNGEPEPLYAVYHETALPKLRRYLESGRRSARGALQELHVEYVNEERLRQADPELVSFQNVNTPQEFALLLAPPRG